MCLESKLYENVRKIYGPYLGKDNRLRVYIVFQDGTSKTVSYPKFVLQEHLSRFIEEPETVDHLDSNPLNNEVANLVIKLRSAHVQEDVKRLKSQVFSCGVCGLEFTLSGKKLSDAFYNRKKGSRGPFCSRSCAGKASHNIDKYATLIVTKEYYTKKSLIKET